MWRLNPYCYRAPHRRRVSQIRVIRVLIRVLPTKSEKCDGALERNVRAAERRAGVLAVGVDVGADVDVDVDAPALVR